MKLFIIFAFILSAAIAKKVETESEKFECVANHLRDKQLLDKNFKYSAKSEELECAPMITELREEILNKTVDSKKASSSSEQSADSIEAAELFKENAACIREQLEKVNFPEIMMKLLMYEKSLKTSKKKKKKLVSATNREAENKLQVSIAICASEPIFGEMFDGFMIDNVEQEEEDTLDEKQNDYCLRKHIIDKGLIDTKIFTVNLNPNNLELNFECKDRIEDMIESLEQIVMEGFDTPSQSKKKIQCMKRALRTGRTGEYIAKISVLSEVQMTDDQKKELRTEFVEKLKDFYQSTIKCF